MSDEPHPDAQSFMDERSDAPPLQDISLGMLRSQGAPSGAVESVEETTDVVVRSNGASIPVRLYTPAGEGPFPVLVWAHGGGSILGDIESEDPTARALTNATGCIVASIEYRLAPEHPFPAAFRDFLAVTEWVHDIADEHVDYSGDLLTGGASAGGKLAAATAHYIRDHGGPEIAYQVLIYPSVNYSNDFPSSDEYDGYFLTNETISWLHEQYLDDPIHGYNPYAFPLEDEDFSDLPPATIVTAGFDPLQDACIAYADALAGAGVSVSHHHYEDMIHAFFSKVADPKWDRAHEAMADVGNDIQRYLA